MCIAAAKHSSAFWKAFLITMYRIKHITRRLQSITKKLFAGIYSHVSF